MLKKVSDKLYVGAQVTPDDIRRAGAEGITAIVNNRPDGEEAGQPAAADNRQVAAAAGLGYAHIPVVSGRIEESHVRDFQKAVGAARGPVLAHCRSGTRSLTLHAIGEVLDGRMAKEEVMAFGQRLGFDLSGAVKWLETRGH